MTKFKKLVQLPESKLVKNQGKQLRFDNFRIDGGQGIFLVELRYDDRHGNGHNTFSIAGSLYRDCVSERTNYGMGCMHEDMVKFLPKEMTDLIQWHLFDSENGPLHYVSNTLHHANDKDVNGYSKGEPCAWNNLLFINGSPIPTKLDKELLPLMKDLEKLELLKTSGIIEVLHVHKAGDYEYPPKYTLSNGLNAKQWHHCEFGSRGAAIAFLDMINNHSFEFKKVAIRYSQGAMPNLEFARSSANWPEATLEQLRDKELLTARLPNMMNDFKTAMENIGFVY